MWGQTQLLPCPKPLFFWGNAHHLEALPIIGIQKNCIMNHDVSTIFKATSHATMSLNKQKPLLKCGSQMILSIDFDVMFKSKMPNLRIFLFPSLDWQVLSRYKFKVESGGHSSSKPITNPHASYNNRGIPHSHLTSPFYEIFKVESGGHSRGKPNPTPTHNNQGISLIHI